MRKSSLIAAGVLFALLSLPSQADEAPSVTALKTVGEGQFSYLFWDLYQARLATSDGQFFSYQQNKPLLLELTYQRDISKADFVEATLDQWKAQQGSLQQRHRDWAAQLDKLWRDVKKGDRLACLLRADGLVEFSFNGQPLGLVEDPAFGAEFLDIWLGEKTTAPKLRIALLGRNKNGS
ncbi:chalcone isomerase family protein [Rheinheimera texasensis]|uniref:chalcone isomerase family protein n=1 Tax=Rheinheimera texasensis TaxID=306205 RepID=UPI000A017ADA|nr:chalcone isomerase family protein [Rheinheimera texasensis]